jgi:hypothetical protein
MKFWSPAQAALHRRALCAFALENLDVRVNGRRAEVSSTW